MLRWTATAFIVALFVLNLALPNTSIGRRGVDPEPRRDVPGSFGENGTPLPKFHLVNINGDVIKSTELLGHRVLLIFERSVDWCPFTKARLVELRQALEEQDQLRVVWVMADNQINEKSRTFIDEYGLRDRIFFASDSNSALFSRFGVEIQEPDETEQGLPYPTTLLVDREGIIRFADVREDFQNWLAPETILAELDKIP